MKHLTAGYAESAEKISPRNAFLGVLGVLRG
jgi:hypothetical protein